MVLKIKVCMNIAGVLQNEHIKLSKARDEPYSSIKYYKYPMVFTDIDKTRDEPYSSYKYHNIGEARDEPYSSFNYHNIGEARDKAN